ncbi:hypothetical protein TNCT_429691 [Trichonephila clavata]|uniref:Uncharacterized protein n=1 Tax=Trichonephila clavata TaxID=2740835 RepID=A0A8X6KF63_TRICU|nr:hypothetical protein TNCT_429691 [Trichonephila clavata]
MVTICLVTSDNVRQKAVFPLMNNVADDSKAVSFECCAVRWSVGGEPTAHKIFENSGIDALWCGWCPR